MTDENPTGQPRSGEEPVERSPLEVAEKPGDHELPAMGRAGDGTSDDESLARRPDQDLDEIDGDAKADDTGTPPGPSVRGG